LHDFHSRRSDRAALQTPRPQQPAAAGRAVRANPPRQPSHTHIAKFVANLSAQIKPLFSQILMTCDAQGLIGRDMFAIDGVKLNTQWNLYCMVHNIEKLAKTDLGRR